MKQRFLLRILLLALEIKCQLDATEVFVADLIVCSGDKMPTR